MKWFLNWVVLRGKGLGAPCRDFIFQKDNSLFASTWSHQTNPVARSWFCFYFFCLYSCISLSGWRGDKTAAFQNVSATCGGDTGCSMWWCTWTSLGLVVFWNQKQCLLIWAGFARAGYGTVWPSSPQHSTAAGVSQVCRQARWWKARKAQGWKAWKRPACCTDKNPSYFLRACAG